jgi:hypothetical protein
MSVDHLLDQIINCVESIFDTFYDGVEVHRVAVCSHCLRNGLGSTITFSSSAAVSLVSFFFFLDVQ